MQGRPKRGERPKVSFVPLRRAMSYNWHYRRIMFIAYGTLLLATLAQLAVPALLRRLIDAITSGVIAQNVLSVPAQVQPLALERAGLTLEQAQANATNAESILLTSALIIVLFAVVRGFFAFQQSYNAEKLSQSVAFDLRNDIFTKIQRLSFSYHDKNQTGQLMIRATDDVEKVRIFIGQGLLLALQSVVLLVGTLIIISLSNLALTLAILPILPIALVLFMVFGAVSQPLFAAVQIRLSKLNTLLQENLAGIKVVKAFAREPSEQQKFTQSADDLMRQQLRVTRVFAFLFPVIFLIANLGQAIVLYVGGQLIINGQLTLGQYQEFSLYLIFVFIPIGQLGFIITQMAQASASAGRVYEILDAKSDVTDKPDAITLPTIQGQVAFKEVSFRYPGGAPVLSSVTFEAAARSDRGFARRDRQRQEFDHQLDSALLRSDQRPHHDRRARSARHHDRFAAHADRHRAAGDQPLQRHHPRQRRLWAARRHRRRSDRGGESSSGARLHPGISAGL